MRFAPFILLVVGAFSCSAPCGRHFEQCFLSSARRSALCCRRCCCMWLIGFGGFSSKIRICDGWAQACFADRHGRAMWRIDPTENNKRLNPLVTGSRLLKNPIVVNNLDCCRSIARPRTAGMTWPANMSPGRRYCARRFTWQPRFRNGARSTQSRASSRACARGRLARGKAGLTPY